ncbi:ADP-ribosylglycohydrolase family protein [Alienimonas chondri]|uniref:ADP-ribosyl-[dinitrogen reductase] glycohydrolase n=1 Tax=Alienimonas chondri TaxID=2681879 RepID=A0ABX1VDE8_9PLAN|nr:ADP-ribosylglycohydrolase family protein [Alienimonas chondri]NNJ25446.1 ADP-ribosyl-[dinitrogen reductase] glycohydrolase [Alienimonas chondri]
MPDSSAPQNAAADRFRGCLLGLAVGDAVGTTVEFKPRGSFEPVTDMTGGGPFGLEPGQWTDDTSMALCLADSLLACGGMDPKDQLDRYLRWSEQGERSSNGRCFDIGNTVGDALLRYQNTGDPAAGSTAWDSAGNGSIMRLAPVPMWFFPDEAAAVRAAGESSRTTHGAEECVDACRLLGLILCRALAGASKQDVLADAPDVVAAPAIRQIAAGCYFEKAEDQIQGSGYVVESLEAALWCFHQTDSYEAAILKAANLGRDADTTAAICGQVAGAYYGESGIPAAWRERITLGDEIAVLADRLRIAGPASPSPAATKG